MQLSTALLRTTDVYLKKLREAGITTVTNMLEHFPRAYKDKTDIIELFSLVDVRTATTIRVRIDAITSEQTRNKKTLIKAIVADKS